MTKDTLYKYRRRINGLLIEKLDDISDTLSQFPETDDYVKLKKEEKRALQFALKLIDREIENYGDKNHE